VDATQEVGYIVSLFLFLSFAVWEDFHSKKISNSLILTALLSAILCQVRHNGFQIFFHSLMQAFIAIIVLFPLYLWGVLGAGDVKLIGVTAVFLSWRRALLAFLAGLYFSLIPILFLLVQKKLCRDSQIPMSGPILGGVLFILYKEGCI